MKNASICIMYAVTPCHAGSGSSVGVVDLPIQRERHTNWPVVAGSGVKGAFRAHFDRYKEASKDTKNYNHLTEQIFGTDKDRTDENAGKGGHAGAINVSDLKILAFPMRSNVAPFVWITCPAVLKRLAKDLKLAGRESIEQISGPDNSIGWILKGIGKAPSVVLEDMEIKAEAVQSIIDSLSVFNVYFAAAERLILVSDEVFDYGVSFCTTVNAQIKIDQATGTTATGSLRYQEELPADSLMYCTVFWGNSLAAKGEDLKSEMIRKLVSEEVIRDFVQIGGDETCGRGIFELSWM